MCAPNPARCRANRPPVGRVSGHDCAWHVAQHRSRPRSCDRARGGGPCPVERDVVAGPSCRAGRRWRPRLLVARLRPRSRRGDGRGSASCRAGRWKSMTPTVLAAAFPTWWVNSTPRPPDLQVLPAWWAGVPGVPTLRAGVASSPVRWSRCPAWRESGDGGPQRPDPPVTSGPGELLAMPISARANGSLRLAPARNGGWPVGAVGRVRLG